MVLDTAPVIFNTIPIVFKQEGSPYKRIMEKQTGFLRVPLSRNQ